MPKSHSDVRNPEALGYDRERSLQPLADLRLRHLDGFILALALEFEERAPAEARLNNTHIIGGA